MWREMTHLKEIMPDVSWVTFGDFNVIHHVEEISNYYPGMPVSRKMLRVPRIYG